LFNTARWGRRSFLSDIPDYSQFPRLSRVLAAARKFAKDPTKVWGWKAPVDNPQKQRLLMAHEGELCELDDVAWQYFLAIKAPKFANPERQRGWQQATNALNEVAAYVYLKHRFAAHPRFVPESKAETPDLEVETTEGLVLCESKTVNESRQELEARAKSQASSTAPALDARYFRRVNAAIDKAKSQLSVYRAEERPTRVIFLTLHFDDWVGDYASTHLRQIEDHILASPANEPRLELRYRTA
jgi:hypothetical protein